MTTLNRIYFDYNIYDQLAKSMLSLPPDYSNHSRVYISVAHAEEYFNARKRDIGNINCKQLDIVEQLLVHDLNNKGVLNPQLKGRIINKRENLFDCLERINEYDTRAYISDSAKEKFEIHKEKYAILRDADKECMNNSNCTHETIWHRPEVINQLNTFREYLQDSNVYSYPILRKIYKPFDALSIAQYKIKLFDLKENMFKGIKPKFIELESVIEFLQNVLNQCGYHRDRTVETTNSGVYDTEHAIYATYCNYFITNDNRLKHRLNAIYYYLGIETKCISFEQWNALCV